MRTQALKIPVTKDVCIFCLTRTQFASVRALRRPQRRLLSSTRAFRRPPAGAAIQQQEDGVQDADSAWRSQPLRRPPGGRWARTNTAPSDLTPEEKALRNALQNDSTEKFPGREPTSTRDQDKETPQGPGIHGHKSGEQMPRPPIQSTHQPSTRIDASQGGPQIEFPPATRVPSHTTQQSGRLPAYASAEVPPAVPGVESLEGKGGPRILGSGPVVTPPPPPTPDFHKPQRPRFGSWAKSKITNDLTPQEQALREALQKKPASQPHLSVHGVSHSPHVSSIPGHPSRSDVQARQEARSEETTHTFPVHSSVIQRQETFNEARLPEYRQARDAQLDHYISQSRKTPTFGQGAWYCPSCAQHNSPSRRECFQCKTVRPQAPGTWQCEKCRGTNHSQYHFCQHCRTPIFSATAQQQTDNTKHWKHVRRFRHDASPEPSQPERPPAQGRLEDTQAIARAKAVEQERMERMKRTKGGEFVGLRGQFENATSKALKDSHWPFEAGGPQAPDVEPTTSNIRDTLTTGSDLVALRAQPATNPQVNTAQAVRDNGFGQEVVNRLSKDRPGAVKLSGGWKRWKPPSAEAQSPSTEAQPPSTEAQPLSTEAQPPPTEVQPLSTEAQPPSSQVQLPSLATYQRSHSDQAHGSTQLSSSEVERQEKGRSIDITREREGPTRREPQGQSIARHSMYQNASYNRSNNRDKVRKSKKVVSIDEDVDDEDEYRAARRMERKQQKKARAAQNAKAPATPIYLPEFISVTNLAGVLKVRVEDFIYKLKDLGFEETSNDHVLDAETAGLVAAEFNFEPIVEQAEDLDLLAKPPAEDKSVLPPRPPVVTIMGHVDHGKTTLLDYLRKSSVAASEHGGITQHIGAFSVPVSGGRLITFLDTPGHEAFLSMRQRGANVTDIVILVVAADDSVKPQTIEAIRHAQAAKVPMIVAINKVDKEDSNVERVKQDLARYSVEIEDYGGDTQVVCVSGKTGQGMEELEDAVVALADILDMRSETDGQAEGWVLEATTKKAGRVATVLVKRGTVRPGDIIVAGTSWARVRSLRNEAGVMLKAAGPGTPIEIDGWREQPSAGDEVLQASDEQRAKAVVDYRLKAYERTQMATDMAAVNEARRLEQVKREQLERAAELAETNSDAAAAAASTEGQIDSSTPSFQEVFFVIKADVSGSVEAVADAVSALGNSEVRPHILRTGVGPVTEFDVEHAAVAKGHIISFNTTVDGNMQRMAEAKDVKILNQSIIYRLVDDVKAKLSEQLPDIVTQKVIGEAEIAQAFEINKKGRIKVPVAGCRVRNGVVGRNNKIRVLRGKEVIYDGKLSSLKNVKKDVTEMRKGTECGMGFENWTEFQPGDQVQSYEEISEKRTL